MNESKRVPAAVLALSMVLLLIVAYVGFYFANVQKGIAGKGSFADYRVGGLWSAVVFAPVHSVDRELRHDYWQAPQDIEGFIELITNTIEPIAGEPINNVVIQDVAED